MTPRPHGPEERELAADAAINERGLTNFERMVRAEARVEELEAALREILWRRGDPSVVRQVARRALRGSVPAGQETDV